MGRYLKDWTGASKDKQPPAYVIMLLDKNLSDHAKTDAGIANRNTWRNRTWNWWLYHKDF